MVVVVTPLAVLLIGNDLRTLVTDFFIIIGLLGVMILFWAVAGFLDLLA